MEGKLSLTITPCWELEVHLNSKLIVSVLRNQKGHFAVKQKLEESELKRKTYNILSMGIKIV
jgi:hypothetical protein